MKLHFKVFILVKFETKFSEIIIFPFQENLNTYSVNKVAGVEKLKVLADSSVTPLYSFANLRKQEQNIM